MCKLAALLVHVLQDQTTKPHEMKTQLAAAVVGAVLSVYLGYSTPHFAKPIRRQHQRMADESRCIQSKRCRSKGPAFAPPCPIGTGRSFATWIACQHKAILQQ